MTPKIMSWMLRRKNRKLVFKANRRPDGYSYIVELREGVTTVSTREVARRAVERYLGNSLWKALEEMIVEVKQQEENENEDAD